MNEEMLKKTLEQMINNNNQTNEPNVKKADLKQDAVINNNIKTIHKSDEA